MRRIVQQDGIDVTYVPDFVPGSEGLFTRLRDALAWERPDITVWGRTRPMPRRVAWYARDTQLSYTYSGQTHQALLWDEVGPLQEIRKLVEEKYGPQDAVLANFYKDGSESVSAHRDDEAELAEGSPILSVSFGATRRFVVKHVSTGDRHVFDLECGSLLVMAGETNQVAVHSVPKTSKPVGPRISLTFRQMTA